MTSNATPFATRELARSTGLSPDTLRHYERLGILSKAQRKASGYRMYAPDSLERVTLVQRALQLGFTLKELSEILRARDRGDVPCGRVLRMTEEKLAILGERIRDLQLTEQYMQELVRTWRLQLESAGPGKKAMLLHSLPAKPGDPTEPLDILKRRKRA